MTPSELFTASVSDIHLGHPNTTTQSIIQGLRQAFPDTIETEQLDIIFIVGDVFDRAVVLHDNVFDHIERWVVRFLSMCKRRSIAVRIVEGTPSHDRKQSKIFSRLNEECEFGVDLKYVDILSIEHFEKFDITILYIPDEWAEPDDTWKQVTTLLARHQLEKVDFTLLHGAMDYQLPSFVKAPTHSTERYLSITDKAVFVGHVHIPSQRQHLFSNGSFSRLVHGEDHPKGHWRCTFRTNGNNEYCFVENTLAAVYKTVDCTGKTIDESLAALDFAQTLPERSNIRVIAERGNSILNSIDILRKKYPLIRWTSDFSDANKEKAQSNLLVDMRAQYQPIQITPDNISKILLDRIRTHVSNDEMFERCRARLQESL